MTDIGHGVQESLPTWLPAATPTVQDFSHCCRTGGALVGQGEAGCAGAAVMEQAQLLRPAATVPPVSSPQVSWRPAFWWLGLR